MITFCFEGSVWTLGRREGDLKKNAHRVSLSPSQTRSLCLLNDSILYERWICPFAARTLSRLSSFPTQTQTIDGNFFSGPKQMLFLCWLNPCWFQSSSKPKTESDTRSDDIGGCLSFTPWVKTTVSCSRFTQAVSIFIMLCHVMFVNVFSWNKKKKKRKCTAQYVTWMCLMRPRSRFTHAC